MNEKTNNAFGEQNQNWHMVADFLKTPDAFVGCGAPELIETHISLIFLTKNYVYKLKKPVRFDFLDYSTLRARKYACEQEVQLNRRLAANVYLSVLPVTVSEGGALSIDGEGEPVEWLVKMRRLPQELILDHILEGPHKFGLDMRRLAATLTNFYQRAPSLNINAETYVRHLGEHVQSNRHELLRTEHGLPEALIKRIHGRQLQFIAFETPLFAKRVQDGHIVDGHGDLRPEHICLEADPVIFDCVEFSDELRQVDTIDELCFLAMECERLGFPEYGDTVINYYAETSGDFAPQRLIAFYKSYRACVRAKVAVLRALQSVGAIRDHAKNLALKYLEMADQSFGWASAPLCVITRGIVGTGKSTIAKGLAEILGMDLLQTDALRRQIVLEVPPPGSYGVGIYQAERRREVYELIFELASSRLSERISVILDACFLTQDLQQSVRFLTEALGVSLVIINCECPSDIAVGRIIARSRDPSCLSDAKPEHFAQQNREDEGILPGVASIRIDTSKGTTQGQLRMICEALRQVVFAKQKSDAAFMKASEVVSTVVPLGVPEMASPRSAMENKS
jgi:aminoglycoside phosphotransferase family enzyme/predicted kinase